MIKEQGVHLGGVEEVDAGVEGGVEEAEGLRRPALLPHRHGPCEEIWSALLNRGRSRRQMMDVGGEPKQRRETGGRSGAR